MLKTVEEVSAMLADPAPERRLEGALASYDHPPPALLGPLNDALAREGDVKVRATLVKAVAAVADRSSIPILTSFLKDPDNRVRANAVEALSAYEDPSLVPLFKQALSDPHNRVRGNAMLALAPFAPQKFKETLQQLSRSSLPQACLTALFVFSRLEESWSVALLGAMALRPDNPVPLQTEKVLGGLAEREVPGAGPALVAVRRSAASRISPDNITFLQPPKVTRRNVDALLADAAPRVRLFAVQEAAQHMAREESLPRLRSRLALEAEPHVLATLTKWLGKVGDESDVDRVTPMLEHPDARVRANTLEGLGVRRSPRVRELAQARAQDENPRVRAQAAALLAEHDADRAFAILRDLVLSGDERTATSGLHAMAHLQGGQVVDLLEQALLRAEAGPGIRAQVLAVLRALEDRLPVARRLRERYESGAFEEYEASYISAQISRMDSTDDAVRLDALAHLRSCRSTGAWDYIEELAATDRSPKVREMAARFVAGCNLERQRRVHFHSFGLRCQQLFERAALPAPALRDLCRRVAALDQQLETADPDAALESTVVERRDTLVLLGERGLEALRGGQLDDQVLTQLSRELERLTEPVRP